MVERAGGFVGEHYLGRPYEEPGDGDPLLFAAAEFAHLPALVPGQPYLFQDFGNLGEHCFGREYLVGSGSQVDVVVDGLVWDEGVVLEEVAHIVAPVFSGFAIPSLVTSVPNTWILPESGVSSAPIQLSRVDFPEPLGPVRAVMECGGTSKLRFSQRGGCL